MIKRLIRVAVGYLLLPPVIVQFKCIERDLDVLHTQLIVLEGRLVNLENILLLMEDRSGTARRHYQA